MLATVINYLVAESKSLTQARMHFNCSEQNV